MAVNIMGNETIDTEDGRITVDCDEDGVTLKEWECVGEGTYRSGDHVRMTWAEFAAVNRAVETFAAALNRKNAA